MSSLCYSGSCHFLVCHRKSILTVLIVVVDGVVVVVVVVDGVVVIVALLCCYGRKIMRKFLWLFSGLPP